MIYSDTHQAQFITFSLKKTGKSIQWITFFTHLFVCRRCRGNRRWCHICVCWSDTHFVVGETRRWLRSGNVTCL